MTGTQLEHDINIAVMQRYGAISAQSAALARVNRKARKFDKALDTLKALASAQRYNQTNIEGSCIMDCDAIDQLIAELEEVK